MTELKTLKEIYLPSDGCCCEDNIRQEAIKWIKRLDGNISKIVQDGETFDLPGTTEARAQIIWINQFFNITEDDLK